MVVWGVFLIVDVLYFQLQMFVWIDLWDIYQLCVDFGFDVQFFVKFVDQCLFGGFVWFVFVVREFLQVGYIVVFGMVVEQDVVMDVGDDVGYDMD